MAPTTRLRTYASASARETVRAERLSAAGEGFETVGTRLALEEFALEELAIAEASAAPTSTILVATASQRKR